PVPLDAFRGRSPEGHGIEDVVQQTVGDDSIKLLLLERRVGQVMIFERDPRLQYLFLDSTLAKRQHCVGTVDAKSGHTWESAYKPHRNVGRTAAKIENFPAGKGREPLSKIAWNLAVRFGPVCRRIGSRLILLVHKVIRFGCAFHEVRVVPHRRRYLQASSSRS